MLYKNNFIYLFFISIIISVIGLLIYKLVNLYQPTIVKESQVIKFIMEVTSYITEIYISFILILIISFLVQGKKPSFYDLVDKSMTKFGRFLKINIIFIIIAVCSLLIINILVNVFVPIGVIKSIVFLILALGIFTYVFYVFSLAPIISVLDSDGVNSFFESQRLLQGKFKKIQVVYWPILLIFLLTMVGPYLTVNWHLSRLNKELINFVSGVLIGIVQPLIAAILIILYYKLSGKNIKA